MEDNKETSQFSKENLSIPGIDELQDGQQVFIDNMEEENEDELVYEDDPLDILQLEDEDEQSEDSGDIEFDYDSDQADEVIDEVTIEMREEIEKEPDIVAANNAICRESMVSEDPIDELLQSVVSDVTRTSNIDILPSTILSNELKQIRLDIIDARLRKDYTMVDELNTIYNNLVNTGDITGVGEEVFVEEGVKFEQGLYNPENDSLLGFKALKHNVKGDILKGDAAIMKAIDALNIGKPYQVPLPHTGIWVTLMPPSEWDLVTFYNLHDRDKIMLGRNTHGFIFSSLSVKANHDIFNFILKNIKESNVKDLSVSDLGKIININDLPILIWGFAATIYPQGFPYRRRCRECGNIESINLSLDKMYHLANEKLTDDQKKLYTRRGRNAVTVEEVKAYQRQSNGVDDNFFKFKGVEAHLKQPSLKDYFEDGLTWIDEVIDQYDRTIIRGDYTEDEKLMVLQGYVNSSILRSYSHYIGKFVIDGKEIVGREEIRKIVSIYGSDKSFIGDFISNVFDFRNKSILAGIGIYEYNCKACNAEQTADEGELTVSNVIPISATHLFFLMFTIKYQLLIMNLE